ncbi:MAG: D-aminoacyl-tRNA deacylase [Chitinophagales bacterium]|nr:D-aminoacyl-tRNA deacylase [Chitinophagales bacterium]
MYKKFSYDYKTGRTKGMRAIVQRVTKARVVSNGKLTGEIGKGILVLAGFEEGDTLQDLEWMAKKIVSLRVFSDERGLMNLSALDVNGGILVVSQFTLFASYKKGNRPSFTKAAKPETAIPLYENFIRNLSKYLGREVATGVFGAHMEVELVNEGPVTVYMDSKNPE